MDELKTAFFVDPIRQNDNFFQKEMGNGGWGISKIKQVIRFDLPGYSFRAAALCHWTWICSHRWWGDLKKLTVIVHIFTYSQDWRNDEHRRLGRGREDEALRVLQADGAACAHHQREASEKGWIPVAGDDIPNTLKVAMVMEETFFGKFNFHWCKWTLLLSLMVTFVPKLTMPILPNQTPGGVRDLWSRVGFQPMSYTTHYPWYPTSPPYFRLRSAKKVVSTRNSQVDHIAIVVSDVGRSSAFYGGTLGMVQVLF